MIFIYIDLPEEASYPIVVDVAEQQALLVEGADWRTILAAHFDAEEITVEDITRVVVELYDPGATTDAPTQTIFERAA